MDYLKIVGGVKLQGAINISGAKNAALPLMASTLLSKNKITIKNLPNVIDIKTFLNLLEMLGSDIDFANNTATIEVNNITNTKATYDIVRKMRASILVLGPLLARFRQCEVSLPGGCAIGARPVDLHIKALEKMGANIKVENGYIVAEAKHGLQGTIINFDKITVTGSENIIMAASLAHGKSKILNVAKEPEVVQLCEVLQNAGVDMKGIGSDELEIYGTSGEGLEFKEISVIPDRIEAGTYLCAAGITNSQITLHNIDSTHLGAVISKLEEIGFKLTYNKDSITIYPAKELRAFEISTTEYPGFPTDMQAQFMALATQCNGVSIIEERLFENRFMHVSELQRMGANIILKNNTATINGKNELFGAPVMATDLRASSALILAALIANGESTIHRIYHLDRGYENLEEKFLKLGANIVRDKE